MKVAKIISRARAVFKIQSSYKSFHTLNYLRPRVSQGFKFIRPSFMTLSSVPQRRFNADPGERRVTPKILCDIIGTKYYPHNEEIGAT